MANLANFTKSPNFIRQTSYNSTTIVSILTFSPNFIRQIDIFYIFAKLSSYTVTCSLACSIDSIRRHMLSMLVVGYFKAYAPGAVLQTTNMFTISVILVKDVCTKPQVGVGLVIDRIVTILNDHKTLIKLNHPNQGTGLKEIKTTQTF